MEKKNKRKRVTILSAIIFIAALITFLLVLFIDSEKNKSDTQRIPYLSNQSAWVDSLMMNMSIEQKIGSLIIYDAGNLDSTKDILIDMLVYKYHIGGISFKSDSLQTYIDKINNYQTKLDIPVFSINNFNSCYPESYSDIIQFPCENALNAVTDDSLKYDYVRYNVMANGLLAYNYQIIDQNLFQGDSSIFSYYIESLQDSSIIACLKLNQEKEIVDSITFKQLNKIVNQYKNTGLSSLFITEDFKIDTNEESQCYSNYLRSTINYDGLIISEYGSQKDLQDNFAHSEVDMIFVKNNIINYINGLKELYVQNKLSIENLDNKVRKILKAKSWVGLEITKKLKRNLIIESLNNVTVKRLSLLLRNNSITICNNQNDFLPLKSLVNKTYVYNIGKELNSFNDLIKYYANVNSKYIEPDTLKIKNIQFHNNYNPIIITLKDIKNWEFVGQYLSTRINENKNKNNIILINFDSPEKLRYIKDCPVVIQVYEDSKYEQELAVQSVFGGISVQGKIPVEIAGYDYKPIRTKKTRIGYTMPEEFGLSSDKIESIDTIAREGLHAHAFPGCQIFVAKEGKVIYHKTFGHHTYSRKTSVKWDDLYDIASITKIAATTIATMKMIDEGKLKLHDKLEKYFENQVIEYTKIKPDTFIKIDTLEIKEFTKKELKKLVKDKDTIHLNDTIFVVYDTLFLKVTPKRNIFKCSIKDMLMHKSGLPPSMPILRYILYRDDTVIQLPDTFIVDSDSLITYDTLATRKDTLKYLWYKYFNGKKLNDTSEVEIAKKMYLRKEYQDTLWIDTKQIRVYSKSVYMYSDVNPILIQQTIDTINKYSINKYLRKRFYKPLGLRTTCYLPLKNHKRTKIVPTEDDKYWRAQLLRGYVHDPSAALLGGIAGNAGLFSNAHDLGILFQMLLNGGVYGGKRYLNYKTINKFTAFQPETHRGLGFDKASKENINAPDAPTSSYGHTGFTGTCVWVDPENQLVYVFLSNRVNPTVKNWKSNTLKIRQRIHQVVYDAIAVSEL